MKRNHLRTAFLAAFCLIILLLLAYCMKKSSDRFDSRHPVPANPFESETAFVENIPNSSVPDSDETQAAVLSSQASESGAASAPKDAADTRAAELPAGFGETEETEMPEQSRVLPSHQILFVGDSRTIGMQNALKKLTPEDPCLFVGKVGEGCAWFTAEGQDLMAEEISAHPDIPVVLNFGVNDPDQIEPYLNAYASMMDRFPDTRFYFLSVNPVQRGKMVENGAGEDALALVTDSNITKLNTAVQTEWPDRYLDSYTILKLDGFETVDGLHYTRQTYLRIHRFVVSRLFP